MNLKLVLESKLKTRKIYTREKDSYEHLKQQFFRKAFKVYTPVLKGFPDFIAIETYYPSVCKHGFYEVKFQNSDLTINQIKFFNNFSHVFNCYVIRVYPDASFQVFQYLPE